MGASFRAGLVIAVMIAEAAVAGQLPPPRAAPSEPLTRTSIQKRTQDMFLRFDVDRDGIVTGPEYLVGQAALREEEQRERFRRLDVDRDGRLTPQEFSSRPVLPETPNDRPRKPGWRPPPSGARTNPENAFGVERFVLFDADGDRRITLPEAIASALSGLDQLPER
jgi:hypothetical protein